MAGRTAGPIKTKLGIGTHVDGLTEIAGVENAAPGDTGGKRGSGKRGTKFRGVFRISS